MKALAVRIGMPELATRIVMIFAFAFATALAAQVRIPLPGTVVPATLQTAIVLLAGLSLGGRDGALSQALYVAAGVLGLPFFAGGATGLAALFGPTGGYLIGFVLAAWLTGRFAREAKSYARLWLATFAASFAVFIPGLITLKLFTASSWEQAVMMGLAPFLLGDVVKVTLAATAYRLGARRLP